MFTGIVSAVGRIVAAEPLGKGAGFGKALTIETPSGWLGTSAIGDSIAIAGACMTVVDLDLAHDRFRVEISAASLAATSGLDDVGEVNLEKALRAGDRLDGHLVSGHVDGVATVRDTREDGFARVVTFNAPPELLRYVVEKGSIAVDGVSLTVSAIDADSFSVSLIPETLERTTLGAAGPGRPVNLEVDVLAKYVEKLVAR